MELFPKKIIQTIPKIGETDSQELCDVTLHVKFCNPIGSGVWYVSEYNPTTGEFFGYAEIISGQGEWGSFYLDELQNINLPGGFRIERDILFTPKKFKEIKQ